MVLRSGAFAPNRLILAAMLAVAFFAIAGGPLAYAARSICRTDPIVTLSDGRVVTLYADIESDLSSIESVDYELHVPPGLSVVSVVHPDPLTADLETFSFYDDGKKGEFKAFTLVTMKEGPKVKVRAFMDIETPGQPKIKSIDQGGDSGKRIETKTGVK